MRTHRRIIGTFGAGMFLLLFANCGGGKTEKEAYSLVPNPPFVIGDAYYQEWVAGIPEGGSGTNIYITLADLTEEVKIEKIYFQNKVCEAQLSSLEKNQFIGYFRNDMRKDIIMDIDPAKEAQNTPREPYPFDLKDNEAILGYISGNEMKYTKVPNIRKEDLLAYPSTKPIDDN
jgi:hypothetical protein